MLLLPLIISKVITDFVDDVLFIFLRAIGQFSLRGIVIKVHTGGETSNVSLS